MCSMYAIITCAKVIMFYPAFVCLSVCLLSDSIAGRAQDRESSPANDRRSTTVPRHQFMQNCQLRTKTPNRLEF